MAFPRIVYPSGGGTTLNFLYPARFYTGAYKTIRHDNVASSGVQERIWERTDTFLLMTMEYIKGTLPLAAGPGTDVYNWGLFMAYALQGGAFDFYPDPVASPTDIRVCFLEHTDYNPKWKSLGMFTFDMVLRYRVGWPASPPGTIGAVTSFSDTFNRSSGPLGEDWILTSAFDYPVGSGFAAVFPQIAACNDTLQGLVWNIQNSSGSPTEVTTYVALPSQIGKGLMHANQQYVQGTFVYEGASGGFCGLSVMADPFNRLPNAGRFLDQYFIFNENGSPAKWRLTSFKAQVQTVLTSAIQNLAVNDIVRLSSDVQGNGNVILRVTINGTLVLTYTDSAIKLTKGTPALAAVGTNGFNTNSQWRNISIGTGL